jgi:peptidoglycan/LPS O-acetylase OafA/YrhL
VLALVAVSIGGMIIRGGIWLARVGRSPFGDAENLYAQADMDFVYYPTWSRLDGLLAGVATATFKTFRPTAWRRIMAQPNWLLVGGLCGLGLSMLLLGRQATTFIPAVIGYPLLAWSVTAIVTGASERQSIIGSQSVPGAKALATVAYSIYLAQKLAYHIVDAGYIRGLATTGWTRFIVAVGVALLLGTFFHCLVERPFLRLRDRWDGPSRSSIAIASF